MGKTGKKRPQTPVAVVGLEGKHSSRRKFWGSTRKEGKCLFSACQLKFNHAQLHHSNQNDNGNDLFFFLRNGTWEVLFLLFLGSVLGVRHENYMRV